MKLAYVLNKQLNVDKLLKDLQKLVSKIPQDQLHNTIVTINLLTVNNHIGDNPILKLTSK